MADVIRILVSGSNPVEIFFNTQVGTWQTLAGANAQLQPIYPDGGVEVLRRGQNAFTFSILGEVKVVHPGSSCLDASEDGF